MITKQAKIQDFQPLVRKENNFASYFVFLFWPLLGTILSFRHYKLKSSQNVVWLFCIFVGLSFNFADGADSNRYKDDLKDLYGKSTYTLEEFRDYLFSEESTAIDFVQPLINFIVSRFTDNEFFLFGVYGFVFGFFYSRNVWYLVHKVQHKIKVEALAFLFLFAFLVPCWSINGFRFWTATHIFFYGVIQYFEGNKKGLFVILGSIFVHYTYLIGLVLFGIYLLIGNRLNLLFIGYILSLFLSFVDLAVLGTYVEGLSSERVKGRTSTYLTEEYAEVYFDSEQSANWYIKYRYNFIKLLVVGSYLWIYLCKQKLVRQNPLMLKFFCIGLIFMSFANIAANIPGMGRFFFIGFMAVILMLFLFFQLAKFKRRPDWYKVLSIFSVFIFCIVELRIGFDNLSVGTLIGNPFTLGFFETKALIDFIKGG